MIQHVSLEVTRGGVDAESAFWELLGFAPVEPPDSLRERARWLQSGPTQVHLLYVDTPAPQPRGHVAVVAPQFERTAAALGNAGFAVEPRTRHWDAARAYVRSPAGHLVEVMAAPPP